MKLIWATRGRSWGFRFLLAGGYPNPLPAYESAFADLQGKQEAYRRVGEQVSLRLLDPLNRRDAAGRIIPHDFVVMGPLADDIHSVADGRTKVWPLVADVYARVWSGGSPSALAVQSAFDIGPRPPHSTSMGDWMALTQLAPRRGRSGANVAPVIHSEPSCLVTSRRPRAAHGPRDSAHPGSSP